MGLDLGLDLDIYIYIIYRYVDLHIYIDIETYREIDINIFEYSYIHTCACMCIHTCIGLGEEHVKRRVLGFWGHRCFRCLRLMGAKDPSVGKIWPFL